jgi:iron complex transport system substrate-binding protein
MRYKPSVLLLMAILILALGSCQTKKHNNEPNNSNHPNAIKYAKGFDITPHEDHFKLVIHNPYLNAEIPIEYKISTPRSNGIQGIKTPLRSVVVTSTTHIPFLDMLGVQDKLVGFPNTNYISSAKTRARIDEGSVLDLGNEEQINTELLMALHPDLVIGFSLYSNNKMFANIEKMGIPVILNGDWLEETPLGRAEWIKFFGLLFDKLDEANRIFDEIERNYLEAKAIASQSNASPTVISGGLFKDIWNLPAGNSFEATFLNHANTDYLYSKSQGKGSLSLSMEAVYEKAKDAEIWISPSYHETLASMKSANEIYAKFKAFETNSVYTFVNNKGPTGGVIYFELAPARPDLVLKDLIKIAHPEMLPEYEMRFFELLQ